VVLLVDGRVGAEGPHEHLLATSPAYREVLASIEATEAAHEEHADVGA
jgi:hypothetical protein